MHYLRLSVPWKFTQTLRNNLDVILFYEKNISVTSYWKREFPFYTRCLRTTAHLYIVILMQDYKSLRFAVTIWDTSVNS